MRVLLSKASLQTAVPVVSKVFVPQLLSYTLQMEWNWDVTTIYVQMCHLDGVL